MMSPFLDAEIGRIPSIHLRHQRKEETASGKLLDQRVLPPMRFAQVQAEIRRRAVWLLRQSYPGGVRVQSFLPEERQPATAIEIPGETI